MKTNLKYKTMITEEDCKWGCEFCGKEYTEETADEFYSSVQPDGRVFTSPVCLECEKAAGFENDW